MKVRWLGNAAVEIFGEKHILIDPNFTVKPEKEADIVLLTHEHDDHFSPEYHSSIKKDVELFGPKTTLEKFDLGGKTVEPGDELEGIKVLDCDCYGSEESVSYLYQGILHSGDSAYFPEVKEVKLIFTACFPDYHEDYISAFKRLDPRMVIPFHYDPKDGLEDAEGLKERMDEEGIPNKLLEPGDHVESQ